MKIKKKKNNLAAMEQLFYAPDIRTSSALPEEESVHCVRVLRMKTGDKITITDGKGYFYTASIENTQPKHCQVSISKCWPQKLIKDCPIHVAIAPPKNFDRMEWFVEKATDRKSTRLNSSH